ncbi:VapE domain-containing protein [Sulfurimonas sp.]|uniref:VapE domain-containing protein n=1 Tax=Sulfurimonas sp. TaxID=2022749 RepID=UPI0025CC130E|nr:VapE domain-containing protein [Sulfurimonas sp.]
MSHQYTVVTSSIGALNKSFAIDGTKKSNAYLTYGHYKVEEVQSIEELLQRFKTLTAYQAIIPSKPKNGKTEGIINSETFGIEDAITRTKKDFSFDGKHILCFDYDPDVYGFNITSQEHFTQVLRAVDPELINCKIGVGCGSSYGVYRGDEAVSNKLSFHAYILIENATDERVQAYKESLKNSCWKLGYGHIKISKAGSLLQRQIFDDVVLSPERLLYEALPTLAEGLTQVRPDDYINGDGVRDLSNIEPDDGEGKKLFEKAKQAKAPEAKIIRDSYIDTQANELVKTKGINYDIAKEAVRRRVEESVLTSDDILYSKDKGVVNVSSILLNPELYKNLNVLDPINPKTGEYVAMVYVNDYSIIVHSFKNGGVNYKLVADESIIEQLVDTAVNKGDTENKKFVSNIVALCDGAKMDESKRKEYATTLKSKKIVTSVNHLKSKIREIAFPDFRIKDGETKLLNTLENLEVFLEHKSIGVQYDEILKDGILTGGEGMVSFTDDTDDKINTQFAKLRSESVRVGLPEKIIDAYLPSIIDSNSINPLLDMVKSKPWDGVDRISQVLSCLITKDDPFYVKEIFTNWIVQCVAAWDYARSSPIPYVLPRFENVLVYQAPQGIQKTKFFEMLVPTDFRKYVTTGIHLDTTNKDSVKLAICAGIAELGEIDSTFKKEVAEIKAFLSKPEDVIRLPYAQKESRYKRRTSFCASVNSEDFLVDPTGNRRFHPISLLAILFSIYLEIDKQQLWAQAWDLYVSGRRWWVDPALDVELFAMLNMKHSNHMVITAVDDIIERVIRDSMDANSDPLGLGAPQFPHAIGSHGFVWKTATEIATHYKIPSTKRGISSTIKKELLAAGIEQKGNLFKVRLAH